MAVVGLAMVAFIVIKTGRDALVVGAAGGADRLPLAFGVGGVAALVAAALHVLAMSRFGVRRVRIGLFVASGIVALLAPAWAARPDPSLHVALFALVPVVFAALFADAWLLVGDAVQGASREQQRAAYVRVAAASTAGGIAGAAVANGISRALEPTGLIAVGGGLLLGVAVLCAFAPRRETPSRSPGKRPAIAKIVWRLGVRPFVALLSGLAALGAVVGILVDLQLYAAAAAHGVADAGFFSSVYLAVSVAALAFQLVAGRVLERRIGIVGVLALLPLGLSGLASVAVFTSTLGSRLALRAAEGGLKAAVHRAAWERAFQPIPEIFRPYVKTVVDGLAARLAETATGFVLAAVGLALEPLGWVTLAAASSWLGLTFLLRRFTTSARDEDGVPEQRLHEACPVASILGQEQPP